MFPGSVACLAEYVGILCANVVQSTVLKVTIRALLVGTNLFSTGGQFYKTTFFLI